MAISHASSPVCGGRTRLATGASGRVEAVDRSWRVVFRGPVSDKELNALPADLMIYVSGHEVRGQRASTIWVRAASAAEAKQAVEDAISTSGSASEAMPLPYWISAAVPDEDANALERALDARRARPGWIFASHVTKDPSDGFAELQYEVVAETDEAALRRGMEDYRDLRLDAGLPPTRSSVRKLAATVARPAAAVPPSSTARTRAEPGKDHVKRRHGVVHKGVEVDQDQATASLAAAREMIERIQARERATRR